MNSLSDQFVKNTGEKLNIPEDLVQKVVSFQWKSIKEATLTGSVIEISGMARLRVRPKKVEQNKQTFQGYYNASLKELDALDKDKDDRWYAVYKKSKNLEKDLEFLNMKKV